MSGRKRDSDRRGQPRFEVVGDLWGTLDIVYPLPVVDISPGGALIRSDRPWEVGSVHSVSLANGTHTGDARVCVRHVRSPSGEQDGFLVGVAFLGLSPVLAGEIARWIEASGEGAER